MKKNNINPSAIIFIIGLFPLAYFNEVLKAENAEGWLRVLIAVIYLLVLRSVSDFVAKKVQSKTHE